MTASAALTTTVRIPFWAGGHEDTPLSASIVYVEKGDKTTVAIERKYFPGFNTKSSATTTETWALIGSTSVEHVFTSSDVEGMGDFTASTACEVPTSTTGHCTTSFGGEYFKGGYCSFLKYTTPFTTTITPDGGSPYTETYDAGTMFSAYDSDEIREWCTGKGDAPKDLSVSTTSVKATDTVTLTLVITAGEEKLTATTGATPNKTGPEPTGTQTKSGEANTPENTGAAAVNVVPVLSGLGAAVAAFML